MRRWKLATRYGITLEEYDAMLEAHGVKVILLGLKELLTSRQSFDTAMFDDRYSRAANALSLMAIDAKFRGV